MHTVFLHPQLCIFLHSGDSEKQADGWLQPGQKILRSQFLMGAASKDIPCPARSCLEIPEVPELWETGEEMWSGATDTKPLADMQISKGF